MTPKYTHITVPLTGEDGNTYAVLGRVLKALRQAFQAEATSGDYDHLLQTVNWE
jgi:hypothetical protein